MPKTYKRLKRTEVHTCQMCRETGTSRQVHHIDRNRQNNDPSNLMIVCPSCHRKEHIHEILVDRKTHDLVDVMNNNWYYHNRLVDGFEIIQDDDLLYQEAF